MTCQEYRLVVIDLTHVLMFNGTIPVLLDARRAKLALEFLNARKQSVTTVPNRSFELAQHYDETPPKLTPLGKKLLSIIAEYKDPIMAMQILALTDLNRSTVYSRLTALKHAELVTVTGKPFAYMATAKGHAALVAAAEGVAK